MSFQKHRRHQRYQLLLIKPVFIQVSESVEEFGNKLKIKNANARKLNHFYKNLEGKKCWQK